MLWCIKLSSQVSLYFNEQRVGLHCLYQRIYSITVQEHIQHKTVAATYTQEKACVAPLSYLVNEVNYPVSVQYLHPVSPSSISQELSQSVNIITCQRGTPKGFNHDSEVYIHIFINFLLQAYNTKSTSLSELYLQSFCHSILPIDACSHQQC